MKPPIANPKSKKGAALIIALAILVLVMALVLGFLSRVKTERVAASGYASSVSARILADSAAQVVQAQIDAATKQGISVAWVSQPGLIRTFDNSGVPLKSYKLYSAAQMQQDGALVPATEAATLQGWFDHPSLFTDINMPVDSNSDGTPDIWPILDPSAAGTVQGFAINSAPTGKYLGITQAAPMPVAWLYILQDGQMVAPTENAGSAMVGGASKTNPIVGRIAFWTDDESCKINVNTASEGMYWDVPRFCNIIDQDLGKYQPVKNEFQGYPGHPATVSLSAVFPGLSGTPGATAFDKYYSLAPRIQPGGSKNSTALASSTLAPVTLDQDRLYANDDELLFNNARLANASLTAADLQRGKFFLTTTSRAPETNLFNLPKIVCWPLHTDTVDHRSAFDKLISFCGTLNTQPYYFQRQNKDSTTEDYTSIARNMTLYSYLQKLTNLSTPGFGGTLNAKFGADRDQLLTEIFDYIRCTNLNDLNFSNTAYQYAPGTGSKGLGQGEVAPITIGATRGFGRFTTISEVGLWLICTADPTVAGTPTVPTSNDPATNLSLAPGTPLTTTAVPATKQIRVEATLILDPFTPMQGAPIHPDVEIYIEGLENWSVKGDNDATAQNFGFPNLSQQTDSDAGVFRFGMSAGYVNAMPNAGGHMGTNWALNERQVRARNGGRLLIDPSFNGSGDGSGIKNQQYPFVSEPLTLKVKQTSPTLTVVGPPITITIKQRTTGTVIQTIKVQFPSSIIPAPILPTSAKWTFQQGGCGVGGGRFIAGSGAYVERSNDVIQSLVAATGGQTVDPRFIAMTDPIVDGTFFSLHPRVNGTSKMAHTLITNPISGFGGYALASGNTGTLTSLTGTYPWNYQPCPKVPFPALAAMTNGDWDNGIGNMPDGGYLNEPDQGNLANKTNASPGFGYTTPYFSSHNALSSASATFTSPSRMMPSPGMFGSLPTGLKRGQGWQTLLFRRQPTHPSYAAGNGNFISNPDYLMMDLFWMPVVEPYAISEPLSTAGKINMNSQIIPFTYLERTTGLYAVLKNEKIISVPKADYNGTYKDAVAGQADFNTTANYRRTVKIPETLEQFNQRFNNADGTGLYAFRSAAEICDLHIIPDNATVSTANKTTLDANMATYWASNGLTGDNSRERIYTTIYPRLTTKSNTFTIYFRAQSLKQGNRNTDQDKWLEGKDTITGEYRGSTTIERYIDPNNTAIPDYAANPAATPSLDSLYHWRVRAHRQFAP